MKFIIMKFMNIKNIIQQIMKKDKKVLGRWNIPYSIYLKMNKKVDLSNEDHCGPCGQYLLEQNKINLKKPIKK
jgi:hypothetical protein